MKASLLILGIGVLLASISCNAPVDEATAARIAALEAKVATLEQSNANLALKGQVVSSLLFGSPIDNFFATEEFWENPYDSGLADCQKRCIATVASERAACETITDATQRLQCYTEATERASNCQRACAASFPPPTP